MTPLGRRGQGREATSTPRKPIHELEACGHRSNERQKTKEESGWEGRRGGGVAAHGHAHPHHAGPPLTAGAL